MIRRSRTNRICAAAVLAMFACSKPEPVIQARSIDSAVAAIDRRSATLRHDTTTVFGLSSEGAGLDASYAGDTLVRLHATFLGETGKVAETFYFDSTLFFVSRTEVRYTAPMSGVARDSSTTRYDLRMLGPNSTVAKSLRDEAGDLIARLHKQPKTGR